MIRRTDNKRDLLSMMSTREALEQWDRYWAYGNLHSFSQVRATNYDGVLAEFWGARFRDLAPGSHILDIATGNGAIALLALQECDSRDMAVEVSGVDLADIKPAASVQDEALQNQLRRIRFHPRTGAEALPFAGGTIDLVCSQFGIEYSDLTATVNEIARVLRAGGRLALVLHHRESSLLQAAQREIEQLQYVMDREKVYLRARNVLRAMEGCSPHARAAAPKVRRKLQALNDAMRRVEKLAGSETSSRMLVGPLRYIREIFGALDRTSPGELLGWLSEAQARVAANRQRLADMVAAALDESQIQALAASLEKRGVKIGEVGPLRERDRTIIAWSLEGTRL